MLRSVYGLVMVDERHLPRVWDGEETLWAGESPSPTWATSEGSPSSGINLNAGKPPLDQRLGDGFWKSQQFCH